MGSKNGIQKIIFILLAYHYPVTTIGRIVTLISSVFGIAIVALPASIITAGYMNEFNIIK